jgi:hypothetical protein
MLRRFRAASARTRTAVALTAGTMIMLWVTSLTYGTFVFIHTLQFVT